jgi:hypothetical protein
VSVFAVGGLLVMPHALLPNIVADITESFTLKFLDRYLPGILPYATLIKAILLVSYLAAHHLQRSNIVTVCLVLLSSVFLITLVYISMLTITVFLMSVQLKFCVGMIDGERVAKLRAIRSRFVRQF